MPIQLSALQQHCFKGIGITPWQLRDNTFNESMTINDVVVSSENDKDKDDTVINEPNTDYQTSDMSVKEVVTLSLETIKQLELLSDYITKHQGDENVGIEWQVNSEAGEFSFDNNLLIIPASSIDFMADPTSKKQLWALLTTKAS